MSTANAPSPETTSASRAADAGRHPTNNPDESAIDQDRDPGRSQLVGATFEVVDTAPRGPFRFAVLDSTGAVRDVFRSRRSAEHAARMLGLGAGYDRHAVLGARVFPVSAPAPADCALGAQSANHRWPDDP